jgi:DNA topoisomerase-2
MIMTDQDHDGSHIKGLLINFVHKFWPSLMEVDGFLVEFVTPIIKVFRGKQTVRAFFTIPEFNDWMRQQTDTKSLKAKYYKGLGTSTSVEAKEYFA